VDDSADLPQLRAACLRALAAYVFEADRTLKLVASIKKLPLTSQKRWALIEQQQKEHDAYRNYQFDRAKLFQLALHYKTRCQTAKAG
jgi:hypothetical protein